MKKHGTLRGSPVLALLMLLAMAGPAAGSTSSATDRDPVVIDLAGMTAPVRIDRSHPFLPAPPEGNAEHAAWEQEDHPFWSRQTPGTRLLGIAGQGWWLQARLANSASHPVEGIIEIHQPTVDDARFELHCSDANRRSAVSGDDHPFTLRDMPDRYPAFAITIPPGGTCRLLIAVHSGETLQLPVFLSDPVSYTKSRQRDDFLHGILLGIDLLLLLAACAMWLSKRSGASLLLLFMIGSHALLVFVMGGIGYQFLWGDQPLVQRVLPPLSIALAWIATGIASCRLLPRDVVGTRSRALMAISYALAGAFGLLGAGVGHPALMALLLLAILPGLLLLAGLTLSARHREPRLDSRILAATCVLVGTATTESLGFLGVLPLAEYYLYTLQIGFTIQGALLLDAISNPHRRQERTHRILQPEPDVSKQVAEMTRELSEAMAQLKSENANLERLSRLDGLTGAFNRRFMDSSLSRLGEKSGTDAIPVAFILVDIDFFKAVNDQYGHPAGDECLREVAMTIRRQLRDPPDLLCRYGGEEFAVILPGCTGENALLVAEKIRTSVENVHFRDENGEPHGVTVSVGLSTLGAGGTVAEMISRADRALYAAKQAGRNRCVAMTGT